MPKLVVRALSLHIRCFESQTSGLTTTERHLTSLAAEITLVKRRSSSEWNVRETQFVPAEEESSEKGANQLRSDQSCVAKCIRWNDLR